MVTNNFNKKALGPTKKKTKKKIASLLSRGRAKMYYKQKQSFTTIFLYCRTRIRVACAKVTKVRKKASKIFCELLI